MIVAKYEADDALVHIDLSTQVPSGSVMLMLMNYREVLPRVRKHLELWQQAARQIPNPELRQQALLSIESKAFHCEGGAIYGLLARSKIESIIRFIVAYQIICDYLDDLCDRSNLPDSRDFRTLHQACIHALTPAADCIDYYQFHQDRDDGGYLMKLVQTCQAVLAQLPAYRIIAPYLYELAYHYCNLQVHQHVQYAERVPRLQAWFEEHRDRLSCELNWYEFSACTGSTLGIFCLVAYASDSSCAESLAARVKNSYFPWVQGLHVLLDCLIDREEDRLSGELNFCNYYNSDREISERFIYFLKAADRAVTQLPNRHFHLMINRALLGVYLADPKVSDRKNLSIIARTILLS